MSCSTSPRVGMRMARATRLLGLVLAIAGHVHGYGGGCDSCEYVPGHGTTRTGTSPFSLRVLRSGADVTSWTADATEYSIVISTSGATFLGFTLSVFQGGSPSSAFDTRAGSLAPVSSNARSSSSCSDQITQTNSAGKTSVTARWTPPAAGTGRVTVKAVVVRCKSSCAPGENWALELTLPELTAAVSASVTATGAPTETPSGTLAATPTTTTAPTLSTVPSHSASGSAAASSSNAASPSLSPVSPSPSSAGTFSGSVTRSVLASPSTSITFGASTSPSNSIAPTPDASTSLTPSMSVIASVSASSPGSPSVRSTPTATATPSPTQIALATTPSALASPAASTSPGASRSSITTAALSTSATSGVGAPPSSAAARSPDASLWTSTAVAPNLIVHWQTLAQSVRFRLEAPGRVWLGFGRARSGSMISGTSGSATVFVGTPSNSALAQYTIRSYSVAGLQRVSAPTFSNAVVFANATHSVMEFTRPLAATGDSLELPIDVNTQQGFIWAVGGSDTLSNHRSRGFVQLTLGPAALPACSRSATCSSRGSCSLQQGVPTCACDAGYAGSSCELCAAGYSRANGSVCSVQETLRAYAASTAQLRLQTSFSATGAPGSATRRTFEDSLATELASAMGINRTRITITSLVAGSIIVTFEVAPGQTAAELDASSALGQLAAALSSNSAAIAGSTLLRTADATSLSFAQTLTPGPTALAAQLSDQLMMRWVISAGVLIGELDAAVAPGHGWIGLGFNSRPAMTGTDAFVYEPAGASNGASVRHVILQGTSAASIANVGSGSTMQTSTVLTTDRTRIRFSRPLAPSYSSAVALDPLGSVHVVFAVGAGQGTLGMHSRDAAGAGLLDLRTGTFTAVSTLKAAHLAHGSLMFIAWAVCAPFAVMAARFGKRLPPTTGTQAMWFQLHWMSQIATAVFSFAAFFVIVATTPAGAHFVTSHHIVGLVVVLLSALQLAGGLLRPKKPAKDEPVTTARRAWGYGHRAGGYATLVLSIAAIFLGLMRAKAVPGLVAGYAALVATTVATFVALEVARRRAVLTLLSSHSKAAAPVPDVTVSVAPPSLAQSERQMFQPGRTGPNK